MRAPLSWLREYVDIDLPVDELAALLTTRGLEVSAIEVSGAEWEGVVVARLLTVSPHPGADTLSLTTVDAGDGALQVVCGAHNISPGQLVPLARIGATLPGGRRIERSKIRGEVSEGMLCSPIELGLGMDADGILILGTADELPIGSDLRSHFGETVLDIDVKPNRGDALSMVGLAREIAAFTGAALRLPTFELVETGDRSADHVAVEIEDDNLCPRFTARYLDGIGPGQTPDWMVSRLIAAGMRPVSPVVDVTNYVMHELGQPMHAYDAGAVTDGRIIVRRAVAGEQLETIDHQVRTLDPEMLVIADPQGPIGLAGIMGGAGTEVGAESVAIILESAIFHGPTVRRTARRLALRSEASARHEKGISPDLPLRAADRAAALIAEISGARVASGTVDSAPHLPAPTVIALDVARTNRLLGLSLSAAEMVDLLATLAFSTIETDGALLVTVPPFRRDILSDVDVAEEVARSHGYERIPARLPSPALPAHRPDPSGPRHQIRRVMAGLGLDEVATHALIGPSDLERSGFDPNADDLARVANPLSIDHSILRPVPYPSLLGALATNVRQRRSELALFEIGKTYRRLSSDRGGDALRLADAPYREGWYLGIALLGPWQPRGVNADRREADMATLKGVIEALHTVLGVEPPTYVPEPPDGLHRHLHPGRAAGLVHGERKYGSIGEVHPTVARAWGLSGRPVVAAIHLEPLLERIGTAVRAATVSASQPVDRDLAVAVESTVPVGEVLRLARRSAGTTLVDLRLFDIFQGAQTGDRVSYGLAFRFQPGEEAGEGAVDKVMDKIRGSLRHHLGAEIR
jgi:phenylalanyl-tRNA synthetase beta chain